MRRFTLHPFSTLLLIWLLFFWRYLASQVTFPAGDFTYQFFVFRDIAYRALAAGHLPLWSDCFFAGYPFHADPQSQLFYPPIWISFALLKLMGWGNFPLFALTLETTLHYLLASVFTFYFLRAEVRAKHSPSAPQSSAESSERMLRPYDWAALLGSITFTYGGYLTGYPPLQTAILETVTWLPLILLILRRLAESPITNYQLRLIGLSSFVLAIAFFAGHPQTFLFVAYLAVAYFIHRAAVNARPWRWTLTRLAAIFGLLFGLSLVQLLPQAQYLSLSTRASLTFEQLSSGFPPGIVKQFFLTDPVWSPLYVGILPLALAILAIALSPLSRRVLSPSGEGPGVRVLFWLAVALVSLVLSLGGNTPLYTLAYYLLPGYRLFRGQERLALLVSFSMATLAAFGLVAITARLSRARSSTEEGTGLKAVSLLIVGLTVANLYLTRTSTNLVAPFDPYPYNPILDPIRADPEPFFRVQDDARMQGHFACGYGFKEWGGISPIRPAAWAAFDEHAPESLRWKVIGMKYLITWKNGALTREEELPPAIRVAEGIAPQGEAKVYRMYELPRRAWLVYQTQTTDDVFAALRVPGFDPFATAVIPASSPPLLSGVVSDREGGQGVGTVTEDYPGHLSLTVTADSPALLVISEAYYPGWAASVNGQPAPVLEADAYLLAVPVPAGDSTVELNYRPITLLVGALFSLLSLAACITLTVFRPREAPNLQFSFMPRPLRFILAVYFALGLVYALATPPFEASDEVFHYPFVRNIAFGKGLPVQKLDVHQPWEQVAFHPPAYHALGAALTFWIDTSDFDSLRAANPFARIGIPGAPQNVNYTRAAARAVIEPFALHGSALAIYIIRLLSLLLSACTVIITYYFVSVISPSPDGCSPRQERGSGGEAILATCLLAFNPTFLFISASVNNDSLTWLTAAAALFVAIHLVRGPSQFIKREIGDLRLDIPTVGVLLGIAALAKVSALILTPIVGLALLAQAARTRNWQRFFVNGTIIVGLAALIAGWWYVRNLILYNELLALNIFGQFTAARLEPYTLATFFSEWPSFWLSFWGMFGSFNIMASRWVYNFFTALTLAGIASGAWRLIRNRDAILKQDRWYWLTHGLLVFFIAATAVSLLRWNLINYAAQGRLMFTTLAPLMMYLAAGLLALIPRRFVMQFVGALAGLLGFIALYVAANNVAAAYLSPAPLAEAQLPAALRPINARLAPGAELIGYTLDSPDLTAPNNQLLITLYWRSLAPMTQDYNLFLHILSQGRALVGSVDTWPGGGLRPTSLWKTDEIYQDTYVIQLDSNAATPSLLWLDLAMWDHDPGQPIPITGPDSAPIPSVIVPVGRIDSPEPLAETPANPVGSTLEGGITLIGFDLPESLITNQPITLSLFWQTSEPLPLDYTVFIHMTDANGGQLAADGPPLNGDWPTSAWQANRLVVDSHTLVFPAPGEYTIRVGLYDPATVIPLAAFRADGAEWPDWAIELATVSVK